MSNILEHRRKIIKTILNKDEYWDFHLSLSGLGTYANDGLQEECLASYIDTNTDACITDEGLVSISTYKWDKAVNNGITLENIGFTGVDNALIEFDRDTITEDEFNELYSKSKLVIDGTNERMKYTFNLKRVGGNSRTANNKLFNYGNEIITDSESITSAKLSGGFFQGFFRIGDGCNYSILPSSFSEGVTFEFCLKREDFEDDNSTTLNKMHPENKGFFFYIGTRAENKWWKYYKTDEEFPKTPYSGEPSQTHPENNEIDFETNEGTPIKEQGVVNILSDNGFLIFDRTKDGLTAPEYKEGDTVTIQMHKDLPKTNYFTIVDRTCNGYTAETLPKYEDENTQPYDVLSDLYGNALGFRITDSGELGYRYLVYDCDCKEMKILEEYSDMRTIPYGEWFVVDIRVVPLPVTEQHKEAKMRFMFYVNGNLVMVSKELPMFSAKMLNDTPDKQEGVSFNISLGGGTQGLCDVIYQDWLKYPEYVLPLEQNFGGTFSGYFKSFKYYTCLKNYNEIRNNVVFEIGDTKRPYCRTNFGTPTIRKESGSDGYTLEELFGNV